LTAEKQISAKQLKINQKLRSRWEKLEEDALKIKK
jgi:hypothetical protein